MNGDGFGVGVSNALWVVLTVADPSAGWYDSVYDEELGSQPCIFTSVTPVSPLVHDLRTLPNSCFK